MYSDIVPSVTTATDSFPTAADVEYGATYLKFPDGMPYEEWELFGSGLERIASGWQWWYGDWWNYGESRYGEKHAQALPDKGYDVKAKSAWVARNVESCRRLQNLSFSHHAEVAHLTPTEQAEWLGLAEDEGWAVRELRKAIRDANDVVEELPLPDGKYNLIYADPPWRYDFQMNSADAIENHYSTAPVEVMAEWKIGDLAADDCVLYLWATSPKLNEALPLLDAWGFTYKTCLVWVKQRIGPGYWARQRHELLLVATKGTPSPPEQSLRPDSVIESDRRKHSQKPDEVYDMLETCYPNHSKIELFARTARPGWERWGLEA